MACRDSGSDDVEDGAKVRFSIDFLLIFDCFATDLGLLFEQVHGWLSTTTVGGGFGSTMKAVYCPSGGISLSKLEEAGALTEIADALVDAAGTANMEARGHGSVSKKQGCDASGGAAQGWRTGAPIGRVELLAIEYTADASPVAAAVGAARWMLQVNRTADPTTGLLVLGQGVIGSAAATAAAADTSPYRRGAAVDVAGVGRAAVLIDATPSLSELYSEVWPLAGGVLGWAYSSDAYELVSASDDTTQAGGGALGALLLPRPAGPAPDPGLPVCPGVRLLVVSLAEREASVVPMTLANASFPYGQWELADLSGAGKRSLPTSPRSSHYEAEAELE